MHFRYLQWRFRRRNAWLLDEAHGPGSRGCLGVVCLLLAFLRAHGIGQSECEPLANERASGDTTNGRRQGRTDPRPAKFYPLLSKCIHFCLYKKMILA